MNKLMKVNDQLMGLTMSELTQVESMIREIKTMKAKSAKQGSQMKDNETVLAKPS